MEVNLAIRKLLFLEDCVIIPGLGGFVSNYRPAVIDKTTGTFIPPTKEIVFNSELVQNDGILVSFISKKCGIPVEDARRQIDRFVEETKIKLEKNDPVFIEGIGQFIRDKNHEIRFQSDAGTNLYLDSFGLASFHLSEVTHENRAGLPKPLSIRRDESPRTVEFVVDEVRKSHNNRNLRRIAIAMPLLIAFSLLPFNSRVADILSSSPASMVPEPSLFRLNYPDIVRKDTMKVIVFPIVQKVTDEKVTSDTVTSDQEKPEVPKALMAKYPVIAGCFKIKSNADRMYKELTDKGYPAAIATSRNGLYKVSIESFASRQEAITGLARLKRAEPGMQLWAAL
jgi:nucleoid DNA-binding protein